LIKSNTGRVKQRATNVPAFDGVFGIDDRRLPANNRKQRSSVDSISGSLTSRRAE